MDDLVEMLARAFVRARGAEIAASDAQWPSVVAHYRRMVEEYGETYASARSLINDAFRDAKTALTALEALGYVVVVKNPTEDMVIAGQEAIVGAWRARRPIDDCEHASDAWKAMLAAAPKVVHG